MERQSNRRRLLAAAGTSAVALAGCLSTEDTPGDPSTNETTTAVSDDPATSSATAPAETEPSTSEGTLRPLDAYDFDWRADAVAERSESTPPRVRVALANDASEPVDVGFGPTPPFADPTSNEHDGHELLLYHPDMGAWSVPDERVDGCWRRTSDGMSPHQNAVLKRRTMARGETIAETYALYNPADADACFPDGEYGFEASNFVPPDSGRTLALKFTVTVADGRVASASADEPEYRDE